MNNTATEQLFSLFQGGKLDGATISAITDAELDSLYSFARLKLSGEQFPLALTLLRGLIALRPTCAEYWATMAVTYRHLNQNDAALKAFKQALDLNNKLTFIYIYLADIYLEQGNLSAAKYNLEKANNYQRHSSFDLECTNYLGQLNSIMAKRLPTMTTLSSDKSQQKNADIQPITVEPTKNDNQHSAALSSWIGESDDNGEDVTHTTIKATLDDSDPEVTHTAIVATKRQPNCSTTKQLERNAAADKLSKAPPQTTTRNTEDCDPEVTHTAIVTRNRELDPEVTHTAIVRRKGGSHG